MELRVLAKEHIWEEDVTLEEQNIAEKNRMDFSRAFLRAWGVQLDVVPVDEKMGLMAKVSFAFGADPNHWLALGR